jgi:hypothetical protein
MHLPNSIQIKLVNTPSKTQEATPQTLPSKSDQVAEYATQAAYWTKQASKGVALLYVGKKVVDTTSQIAVIAASAHFYK